MKMEKDEMGDMKKIIYHVRLKCRRCKGSHECNLYKEVRRGEKAASLPGSTVECEIEYSSEKANKKAVVLVGFPSKKICWSTPIWAEKIYQDGRSDILYFHPGKLMPCIKKDDDTSSLMYS